MDIGSVRTLLNETEYEEALREVRPYFENEPDADTIEAAHSDALMLLIEEYEARHYPIPHASPVEVLKSVMTANNYTRDDLIKIIGSKSRVADLLNGRREINIDQIRKISRAWNVPAGALVGDISV
jgi:HTH-type transcriptional regulator/antitoxin HigA